jgi:hypothetical protein
MKINSQATRDMIRTRYGSVRKFARQCMDTFGIDNIDAAYDLVGKTLTTSRGKTERASISKAIRLRLEREGLLVCEPDGDETDAAANG